MCGNHGWQKKKKREKKKERDIGSDSVQRTELAYNTRIEMYKSRYVD